MSDLNDQVVQILAEVTGHDAADITPDKDLAADLKVGSAEAMELLATLEDEFDLDIPEVEAAKVKTVADVFALAAQRAP